MLLAILDLAAAEPTRAWLEADLAGAVTMPGGGGGVGGGLGVALGKDPSVGPAVLARVREVVAAPDVRQVGDIGLLFRWRAPSGLRADVGFAHAHVATADLLLAEPVGAMFGVADALTHRSGVELGAGWDATLPTQQAFWSRLHPMVGVAAAYYPDDGGGPVYAFFEAGLRVDLGRE